MFSVVFSLVADARINSTGARRFRRDPKEGRRVLQVKPRDGNVVFCQGQRDGGEAGARRGGDPAARGCAGPRGAAGGDLMIKFSPTTTAVLVLCYT